MKDSTRASVSSSVKGMRNVGTISEQRAPYGGVRAHGVKACVHGQHVRAQFIILFALLRDFTTAKPVYHFRHDQD